MSTYVNRLFDRSAPRGPARPTRDLHPFVRSQSPIAALDQRLGLDGASVDDFAQLPTGPDAAASDAGAHEASVDDGKAAPRAIIQRKAVASATPPSSHALAPSSASSRGPVVSAARPSSVAVSEAASPVEPAPSPSSPPRRDPEPLATIPAASAKAARRGPGAPAERVRSEPLDPVALFDPTPRYYDESQPEAPELSTDEGSESADPRSGPGPIWVVTRAPRDGVSQPLFATAGALALEAPAYEPGASPAFEREPQRAPQLYIVPRAPRVEPFAPAPAEAPAPAPAPTPAAAPSSSPTASEPSRPTQAAAEPQPQSPARQRPSINSISLIGPLDRHFPNRRDFRRRYR